MTFHSKLRTRSPLGDFAESMTQQSDLPQSDIHNIIKQFERTGVLNHDAKYHGTYGDFGSMPDFKQAQDLIANATSMFNELPAIVREEHANDPALFLKWIQDPKNRDAIAEKGFSTDHLPEPDLIPDPQPVASSHSTDHAQQPIDQSSHEDLSDS